MPGVRPGGRIPDSRPALGAQRGESARRRAHDLLIHRDGGHSRDRHRYGPRVRRPVDRGTARKAERALIASRITTGSTLGRPLGGSGSSRVIVLANTSQGSFGRNLGKLEHAGRTNPGRQTPPDRIRPQCRRCGRTPIWHGIYEAVWCVHVIYRAAHRYASAKFGGEGCGLGGGRGCRPIGRGSFIDWAGSLHRLAADGSINLGSRAHVVAVACPGRPWWHLSCDSFPRGDL